MYMSVVAKPAKLNYNTHSPKSDGIIFQVRLTSTLPSPTPMTGETTTIGNKHKNHKELIIN